MQKAKIISCGAYAPEKVLKNSYFDKQLGEDVSTWLEENVQIYERRWCDENESTADLAEHASRQALERAGLKPGDIDLIIVSTDTPEFVSPSTASVLQDRLGADGAGTFDINTACAGFVTALDIASKYIAADGQYRHILVVGAYAMSKHLNKMDKKTVTLFADGAGSMVLKAVGSEDKSGFLASELLSKGEYNEWMGIYGGGTKKPTTEQTLVSHDHQLKFVKRFPPTLNPEIWTGMIERLNKRIGVKSRDVDHYFITQININSIMDTMDRLNVDRNKAATIMHYYGYTGSACIPMAFNEVWERGDINAGDLVYFVGSGGGLSFASAAFRI